MNQSGEISKNTLITNPLTGETFSIFEKNGLKLLKQYVNNFLQKNTSEPLQNGGG